ncbi:hypothetical protein Ahy_B08g089720 isoform I [Arachis hypogaea]|uniref:ArsA/GET3 Anion-transporting ATPase-like domain-containing protein n=1 Tax=Arachis hypogaea TaxID=3818 RepID=A0A444XYN6_ARAHY|nr:hypothetical protein Ahy_B08g089720 isoform I [Arachis hypogaea]
MKERENRDDDEEKMSDKILEEAWCSFHGNAGHPNYMSNTHSSRAKMDSSSGIERNGRVPLSGVVAGSCTEGVCGFDEMVAGKERKYYMLSGKGGVGKTSCAVSLVVRFANHGHPTMIVSTDPAHSLSDYFAQEVERETAKTADMKEKGANPYDLKQQENVLAESRMMIPDCHKRLEAALVDLKGALAELEKSNEKEGDTEFAKDAAFGYKSSNLRDGSACAVNAASKRDMAVFALGMIKEELMGKHFLSRTTASFVSSYRPTRSRT